MSLREYPPTGIGAGSTWTKDTGDTITSRTGGSQLARYKFKVTSASYANGWYVASADSIYGYSASTTYNADEWPPSGAFDKLDGVSSTRQGLSSADFVFTNTADASPGFNVYITLPNYIKLDTYNIKFRTDAAIGQAPTKWNLYGSTRSASSWALIHTMTASGWSLGSSQTFTASSTTGYNSFRFEFLRSNSSSAATITIGEIRLYGYPEISFKNIINDGYPNDLTTGNSFGMTPQSLTRISTLRGLHGLPKGNIKFSDIITKFNPSDNLFPSSPFRVKSSDGIYVRYDPSNSQVNGTVQHIYFTTQLDTSTDYSGYKKHASMYFLKDIGQNLYWNHDNFVTWMYTTPTSIRYGWKAVPSHTIQNQYLIRSVYNGNYYMGYDSAANRFRIEAQGSANIKNFIFDVDDYPPVTNGLVGLYTSESYNGTQWTDISGSGNHATTKTGTIVQNRNAFNNRDYVSGGTTAGIKFPSAILPSTYTLFHVAKYNGPTRLRIFNGDSGNFLSGFWNGRSGVAHHESWLTQLTGNTNGGEWIVCTDQRSRFRSQKANRTTLFPGTGVARQLTINFSTSSQGEDSDWAVAAVVVYNRELSINEILQMENWLYVKYNLSYMPPIMWGMVGMWTGESWAGTQWTDVSGNANHVTNITGTVTSNYSSISGRDFVSGVPATKLIWPVGILPSTYTIIHLCKYNGTNRGRILNGNEYNWLSGFWGGYSGVAFHEGWLTQASTSVHGDNWVLSTDQNNLYRSNRVNRTTGSPGTPSYARLSINPGTNSFELSDWAVACIIIYNRTLTASEYNTVENWVAQRYSLSSMVTDTTIIKPPDPPTSGMVLWVDALTHSSTTGTNIVDNSQNAYNFTLTNANAYRSDGLVPHFNFEGTYGYANRTSDVPSYSAATIIAFSSILNSTADWRTMLRANGNDHQVLIQSGGNSLGMFNNSAGVFLNSGFNITSLPTPYTSFNMLVWRLGTSSPYYQFSIARDERTYNITDANGSFNNGLGSLGSHFGYQHWGKISTFLYYNRYLSSAEIADIYNQYDQIYNFPFPGDARYFEDGQWNVLYELTNPSRDSSGNLSYSQNNAAALTNKSHNRIAYFMQNRMNNGVMYYIYVSMDSYDTNYNNYRIPDTVNTTGVQQRNVTNLVVYSNHPQVGNYTATSGRLEIWPYNYATTNNFGDGNTSTYDVDDTTYYVGTYGCVQVHDMVSKKTLLAWNNHGSGQTQDIGIGNNDSTNIHYLATVGTYTVGSDWTFAQNGAYGWKFQVLVNTDKEFVNTIGNLESLVGAYSLQRVSNTYTGPTVTVRRSTDNVTADFYANISGDLGTSLNATGQSLVNWLAGATAFVTDWYDQSGKNNHAFQKTNSAQPTINIVGKFVNFATNQFLNLPDGTVPYNNSQYTIMIRHGEINNTSGGMLGSGTFGTTNLANAVRREPSGGYYNYWWNNDAYTTSGYVAGNVVTWKYDGSNRYLYVNSELQLTSAVTTARSSTSLNNTLGVSNSAEWMNGEMYYTYIFNTAISDSDRLKAEASGWIQPEITGAIDNLSGVARNALVGVWSVKRVTRIYYGPTINVRRSTDNVTQDFYSDINGNLGTLLNGRGQSITSWLNGATGFITIWYDQSGNGKHARQTITSSQPSIDITNKQINFRNTKFFDLPDGTVPTGNSNYTFVAKHNTVGGAPGCIIAGGSYSSSQLNALEVNGTSYNNFWWGNDMAFTATTSTNNVVTCTYVNTVGRRGFVNNVQLGTNSATNRSSTTVHNRIGTDMRAEAFGEDASTNHWLNGELYYLYIFNDALTTVDRNIVEAT